MNEEVVLLPNQTPVQREAIPFPAESRRGVVDVHLARGRDAVLALQPLLVNLSRRTGQSGAMDWLHHFVNSPDSLGKTPYLILVGRERNLIGALLLYEYRIAGVGAHVFATDDILGTRTVIAAEPDRVPVAREALRRLMAPGSGAIMALVSIDTATVPKPEQTTVASAYTTAIRLRSAPRYLALEPTIEATLAKMGDDTRRNFRRYRRRAELELGAEFVPHATVDCHDFFDLNRESTNPAPGDVACWRYELVGQEQPGERIMLCGLRGRDGQWLSLMGGRRNGTTTEIDWQLNRIGFSHFSLCTAMRAFMLEHEIARGTQRLVFEGGTPHPMRFAFTCAQTVDLLAMRRHSPAAWLLRKFANRIFPEKNFLRAALNSFSSEEPRTARDSSQDLPNAA
jgi:hypothetical protein